MLNYLSKLVPSQKNGIRLLKSLCWVFLIDFAFYFIGAFY